MFLRGTYFEGWNIMKEDRNEVVSGMTERKNISARGRNQRAVYATVKKRSLHSPQTGVDMSGDRKRHTMYPTHDYRGLHGWN